MTEKTKRKVMIATYHTHILFSAIAKIALVLFCVWFSFSVMEAVIQSWANGGGANPVGCSSFNLFEVLKNL